MKQNRIVFLCLAVFFGLSAFAAAASPQAPAVDTQTASFLSSLSGPLAPALPDLGVPEPAQASSCGSNFCTFDQELVCADACMPCQSVLFCNFTRCTMTCTCYC